MNGHWVGEHKWRHTVCTGRIVWSILFFRTINQAQRTSLQHVANLILLLHASLIICVKAIIDLELPLFFSLDSTTETWGVRSLNPA